MSQNRQSKWIMKCQLLLLLLCFLFMIQVLTRNALGVTYEAKRIGWATMDGSLEQVKKYWRTTEEDSGNLTLASEKRDVYSGNAAVRLAADKDNNTFFYQHWTRLGVTPGARYRVSFQAKGKGEIIACHAAVEASAGRGLTSEEFSEGQDRVALTDSWQLISAEVKVSNPKAALLSVGIRVNGEGAVAFIDELNIYRIWDPSWQLEIGEPHPMMAIGGMAEVKLRLLKEGKPQAKQEIVLNAPANAKSASSFITDQEGFAVFPFTGDSKGLFSFSAVHTASGQLVPFHIDVLEPDLYRQFDQTAKRAALDIPADLLFIGDSLTDMQRGHNYVDKVGFWLRKRFGKEITLKNAGVGGDDITRIWRRMNGNMSQYEQERYPEWQPLFDPKPNYVFFFLGHNDSKLLGASDWKETMVPNDLFSQNYRQVVEKVKRETGAKTIILSTTSAVYKKTRAKVEGRMKIGQKANLFGKPEVLKEFNFAAQEVARKTDSEFLDVYEVIRLHPDKASLFQYDGLHVNNEGNQVLALQVLEYLTNE